MLQPTRERSARGLVVLDDQHPGGISPDRRAPVSQLAPGHGDSLEAPTSATADGPARSRLSHIAGVPQGKSARLRPDRESVRFEADRDDMSHLAGGGVKD